MQERILTSIKKKEIIITLTSFTGVYTLLIYCFSIGFYDAYSLPSIFFSIDTNIIMNNGILLLIITSLLVLPYVFVGPIFYTLNKKIINTNFYNTVKVKMTNDAKKKKYIFFLVTTFSSSFYFLFDHASMYTFIISSLCLIAFFAVYLNKISKVLYFAGLVLTALLLMLGSYYLGNNLAKSAGFYPITTYNNDDYLIIKEYKNYYVIAPMNISQNELEPIFKLIPLSTEKLEIRFEKLESIKIKE